MKPPQAFLPFFFVIAALALGACSSGNQRAAKAKPATDVSTTMPVRRTFHADIAAFGQLAADRRNALSISLPHPTEVTATEVLPGQRVKRGAVLLRLRTDPATRSAYLEAQSAVKTAQEDLARTRRLNAEKLATNTQLDAARKALADAEAAFAAQKMLGGAKSATTLKAPADGVVTSLAVQSGQRVPAGTVLIQFAPTSSLSAQLGVSPAAAAGIHVGMPVAITPVYGAPGDPPLRGTVAMVGDAVNPATHLVDIVATLDKHTPLASGTALSAAIQTSSFKAWSVPRDALESNARGDYVFQIEHGKARRVDVKVVAPDGSPIGVEGAIDPDAPVITLGGYEIANGDPVKAQSTNGSAK